MSAPLLLLSVVVTIAVHAQLLRYITFSLYFKNTTLTHAQTNAFGRTWNFDIAIDAMSTAQYNQFFAGVTDGSNWNEVYFEQTSCGSNNPTPPIKSWGCISGCSNNDAASVCADV
jgi:hypothetical protein